MPEDKAEEDVQAQSDAKVKKLGYKKVASHYLADEIHKHSKHAKLTAAAYHQDSRILVIGFNTGSFCLYEMPHANMIHSLRYLTKLARISLKANFRQNQLTCYTN